MGIPCLPGLFRLIYNPRTKTFVIEAKTEPDPTAVWRVIVLSIDGGTKHNLIAGRVAAEVLKKRDDQLDKRSIPRNAKLKGKRIELTGSVDVEFRLKDSDEKHTAKCFVTKEMDPAFDMVVAKTELPTNFGRGLEREHTGRRPRRR